jgi:Domain of unknown function (DUF1929)/Bacterial Ig-like domain (group 3)/Bacterial Ig-like domain (group 2)/Abnormal spindle-like microcephaly-assoc'd, ASPM-SPD-2-Hydin
LGKFEGSVMSNPLASRLRTAPVFSENRHSSSMPSGGAARRRVKRDLLWIVLFSAMLTGATRANSQNPVGQFSPLMNWPFNPTHAVLLPSGSVLWWASFANGDKPQIWNPATGVNTAVTPAGYDIFCGGHSVMSDGQVLITGGEYTIEVGVPNASLYDPVSGNWTSLPDMNAGRWYPTNTVLANGDVLVTSGEISPLLGVDSLPEVWQASSGTWRDLTTAQFDLPLYPVMYLAPNGTVFLVGPSPLSEFLNTDGTGAWTIGPSEEYGNRGYGSSAMYNNGQIIIVGGGVGPTATAEIINLNDPVPTWRYTGTMANARRNANATILPDGTVLVTGGTSGVVADDYTHPVFPVELWNPTSGTWSTLASLSTYRGYHSVALLLPDGTVLSGGGQCTIAQGCNPNSVEIFSPPYLFAGPRPTITSAPASIGGGQTFFVGTPNAAAITQVSLIRLGAVTHTFNQEQRFSSLAFSQTTGGLNVTAPQNANLAPSGFYMLFVLSNGVPSAASIIHVDNSSFAQSGPGVSLSQTALTPFAAGTFVGSTSSSKSLQLTNLGTAPITINSIVTGTDFTVTSTTCGGQLASGSCTINVAFKPTAGGQFNEFLTISDSDPSSPQTVALSGMGKALKASASTLSFGNQPVGATGNPLPITLTNLGTAAISITGVSYSNPEFGQYLPSSTCGASIPGLSSCQVSSVFAPNASGTQSGTLGVFDSDPSSPTTVTLSGVGSALSFSPGSLSFGNENISATSIPLALTVTNPGTVPVNFSGITLGGTNQGDFAIQTNTCGAALAASTNCALAVTFTPQASGARSATLSFADNGSGSPQMVTLQGNGVVGAALSFSSGHLSFGNESIPKTSTPLATTVTNISPATVTFSSIAVGGADPGDFAIQINTCGATLSAGTNCIVEVTFTPQASGARSATLSFTDSGGVNPQVVALAGHGVAVLSSIAVTPTNSSIAISGTEQFVATGMYTDGSTNNLTTSATWSSSNSGIALVSNTSGSQGLATGAARGTTTISATSNFIKGSTNLTVLTSTATVIASNNNPSTFGQTVTFTATVSPSTATGSVEFVDLFNGTQTVLGTVPISSGTAVLPATLPSGIHSITAEYGGDANDTSSTSAALVETVN